jgi:undecaprenyl diphosphate synthase
MADSPQHVAIIMDGNGRWARSHGLPRIAGHRTSIRVVRKIVELCGARNVRYLTLFAFSSENFQRPPDEVGMLMGLFLDALVREVADLHRSHVKLRFIGDRASLSEGAGTSRRRAARWPARPRRVNSSWRRLPRSASARAWRSPAFRIRTS